eukprot:TRINITY_DN8235_c0_g1_i2.p1 TRINITY_DN8235_c0_g1~~TRINITY_DN8235_c0_g1_i2.p1  ORF type:complete len:665 (+),score=99.56 TRINITY_DN8235_c0_g1_i2:172-2166(+)
MAHSDVGGLLRRHGYTQVRTVGEGSFGKAILVTSNTDSSKLICKMVDISKATTKETNEATKEANLLSTLRHPYIVRYRESFTESGWLCILMDYCECGDMSKQIQDARKNRKPLSEDQVLTWFTQAILALKYIHDQHILHRDLKPQNFFLTKNGSLRMGDFGIAKVLACTIAVARTQIGTPYYLSPELCQERPYTWPSDIWSMGCILYELCASRVPFDAPNIPGLVQKIVHGAVPSVPSQYSEFLRDLCKSMLNRDPNRRPSTDDILKMPQIQAIVRRMVEEVGGASDGPPSSARPSLGGNGRAPSQPAALEGPYAESAGTYLKGDLVEYSSSAHKSWLPAKIINADANGRIIIDLKPNTWISKEDQALKLRPRAADPPKETPARAASPMIRRSPSIGSARGASPSAGNRGAPSSRAASPTGMRRTPSQGAMDRPGSRGYSPAPAAQQSPSSNRNRPPSAARNSVGGGASPMQRCPSAGSGAPIWGARAYKVGDLVEYHSSSHKDWLPATITRVESDGRIIIDLKPNTWLSKDEQASKIRPRGQASGGGGAAGGVGYGNPPASRGASPMVSRRPSSIDRSGIGSPASGIRAMTPGGRAPSPGRGMQRDPLRPPSRAASPHGSNNGYGGGRASDQSPRSRPPGIPPPNRLAAPSPLRSGGRAIAGM